MTFHTFLIQENLEKHVMYEVDKLPQNKRITLATDFQRNEVSKSEGVNIKANHRVGHYTNCQKIELLSY